MAKAPTPAASDPSDLGTNTTAPDTNTPAASDPSEAEVAVETDVEDDMIAVISVKQSGTQPGTIVHVREMFVADMIRAGQVQLLPEDE